MVRVCGQDDKKAEIDKSCGIGDRRTTVEGSKMAVYEHDLARSEENGIPIWKERLRRGSELYGAGGSVA